MLWGILQNREVKKLTKTYMSNFKGNSGKWKVMEVNPETNGWVSIESEIDNLIKEATEI